MTATKDGKAASRPGPGRFSQETFFQGYSVAHLSRLFLPYSIFEIGSGSDP